MDKLPDASRSRQYEARVRTSASVGHLVSADENGKQYQMRYRTGDELVYTMTGAPPELSIDNSGLISGFITAGAEDHYDITVQVKNEKTGVGDTNKFLLAVAGQRP